MDTVRSIITPEPTHRGDKCQKMYYPIPHSKLYDTVRENLDACGYNVVEEAHALSREGARYFGLLKLEPRRLSTFNKITPEDCPDGHSLVVGIRNGHEGVAAALAVGSVVWLCDNLAFSSNEIRVTRAHTRYIMRDLPGLVYRALGMLGDHRRLQAQRYGCYQQQPLATQEGKALILDAMLAGAINTQRVPEVLQHWLEPKHEVFRARSAWSLYNAFTEALKPRSKVVKVGEQELVEPGPTNLWNLGARTERLHGLLDAYCGFCYN
jgi:hypothetical protein